MNKSVIKRLGIIVPVAFLMSLMILWVISIPALADTKKTLVGAINSNDMSYITNHIDSFKLYHFSTGPLDFNANSTYFIGDMVWSLDTMIYSAMDTFINILFNTSSMAGLIDWASGISKSLYFGLSGAVLSIVFSIGALIAFFFYLSKGRTAGLKQLVSMVLVIAVSAFWFSNVGPILNNVNSLSDSLGATVASSVSKSLGEDHSKDSYTGLVSKNKSTSTNSVTLVRKDYFDNSYYKLWKIGAFGQSNVNQKTREDFLRDVPLNDKEVDKQKEKNEVKDYKGFLEKDNAAIKSSTSFAGLFVITLNGIPYIAIGLLNWVVTMIALALTMGMPVLAILSFFPRFNRSLYNGIGEIFKAFFTKGIVVLLIVIVGLSNTIVKALTTGLGTPKGSTAVALVLVTTILQFVLLLMLWKSRNQILSTISGGTINNVPYAGSMPSMAHQARSGFHNLRSGEDVPPQDGGPGASPEVDPETQQVAQQLVALLRTANADQVGSNGPLTTVGDDEQNNVSEDEDVEEETDEKDIDRVEEDTEPEEEELTPDVDIPDGLDGEEELVSHDEFEDDFEDEIPVPGEVEADDPDIGVPEDLSTDEKDTTRRKKLQAPQTGEILTDGELGHVSDTPVNHVTSVERGDDESTLPIDDAQSGVTSDQQVYEDFGQPTVSGTKPTSTIDFGETSLQGDKLSASKNDGLVDDSSFSTPSAQIENDGLKQPIKPQKQPSLTETSSHEDMNATLNPKRAEFDSESPDDFLK